MITYKTPSGKVYTEPKSNYVKAFETKEELQAGVDRFIARFLNLKDSKVNDSISRKQDIKDLPKVYTK